jgi:hypothetical protein
MSLFDFHQFFVRWNFLTHGTLFWFWSCRFSKGCPDWPSRHFIRPLSMLGDHCLTSKNPTNPSSKELALWQPFWPLWPWGSNRFDRLNSYVKTVQIRQKSYKISIKWIYGLCYGLWKISWPFLFFLRSLIPKKSSGMQKPYVWVVTTPTINQHKNSILVHCYKKGRILWF